MYYNAGGGISSCVTAWALTNDPNWKDQYEITIYQQGWRLGGKGASGRNKKYGQRIEEHGLHIWLGWYRNAFKMIQDVYAELNHSEGMPLRNWTEAFQGNTKLWVVENVKNKWEKWEFDYPVIPGDPSQAILKFSFKNTFKQLFELLKYWLLSIKNGIESDFDLNKVLDSLEKLKRVIFIEYKKHQNNILTNNGKMVQKQFLKLRWGIQQALSHQPISDSVLLDELRHIYIIFDLVTCIAKGLVEDKVFHDEDFDKINNIEFSDWLEKHGISKTLIHPPSSFVKGFYDMFFAYENGDFNKPNLEAGTAIHTLSLITAYKGHPYYKMKVKPLAYIYLGSN